MKNVLEKIKMVKVLFATIAVMFLITGCTPATKQYELVQTKVTFDVEIVDDLNNNDLSGLNKQRTYSGSIIKDAPEVHAYTKCNFKKGTPENEQWKHCTIYIPKKSYPRCLTHEIRHIFEGHWHPVEKVNSEDCR